MHATNDKLSKQIAIRYLLQRLIQYHTYVYSKLNCLIQSND